MISVFGSSGFIGSNWMKKYPDSYPEPRDSKTPKYDNVLYFRGTNSNYNVFSEDPTIDIKTNLLLFVETLKNINKNTHFGLISSWFIYHPLGFYSSTKRCQEHLFESYCKTFEIPNYNILRLSNIFGKDLRASSKKNALEFMINKIKKNEDIQIYEGDNFRNFLDVDTCCEAIKFVMENGKSGETYNIGAGQSHRVGDLIEYCIKKINSKSKIHMVETPKFHQQVQVKDFWMDTLRLKELGFNNNIDIYEKLDNLLLS
jgi:nucleoside-diphosphate-sugar epimerase